jgi:predicted RNase H-like HicB family nuclease
MANMQLIARVWPEDDGFVAECVELRVVSQGDTADVAVANLREAVEAFLECADRDEVRERLHVGTYVRTFDVPMAV